MAVGPARSLILNGAGAGRGQSNLLAVLEEDKLVGERILSGRGASERFAPAVRELLVDAGWRQPPEMVAAIIGPGSFTGLRASLSLAAGLVRGWGCQAVGLRLGDALRASLKREDVTTLCLARRGRVFVDEPGKMPYALPVGDIQPDRWSAVAGDALWGEDALAELTGPAGEMRLGGRTERLACAVPTAAGILQAACQALVGQGGGRSYPLEPLYVDPPEAKPPAGGLRPAPR